MTTFRLVRPLSMRSIERVACALNRVAGLLMSSTLGSEYIVWVSTSCRVLLFDSLSNCWLVVHLKLNSFTVLNVRGLVLCWCSFPVSSGNMIRLRVACLGMLHGPRNI